MELFNLPAGPPELCFDKNEFKKVNLLQNDHVHNFVEIFIFFVENLFCG